MCCLFFQSKFILVPFPTHHQQVRSNFLTVLLFTQGPQDRSAINSFHSKQCSADPTVFLPDGSSNMAGESGHGILNGDYCGNISTDLLHQNAFMNERKGLPPSDDPAQFQASFQYRD